MKQTAAGDSSENANSRLSYNPQEKQSPQKQISTLVRSISSNIASLISVTCCYPLEVIKTRMHIQGSLGVHDVSMRSIVTIAKSEGIKGLYRGYYISAICTPLFHTLYFPLYEKIKNNFKDSLEWEEGSFALYSISAGIAGLTCNIITNPFWLVRTRMQAEIFRSQCENNYKRQYPKNLLKCMFQIQ